MPNGDLYISQSREVKLSTKGSSISIVETVE